MLVCFFDIDGTLLSSGGAGQAAMEFALESEFGITRPTEGISVAGRTDHAITTDLMAFHDVPTSDENRQRLLDAYLNRLPFELQDRSGLILPGVTQLLEELSHRNDVELGLLTGNFKAGALCKLEHYQLMRHFKFGGYGDHHRSRDDVARAALKDAESNLATSIAGRDCVVIGDTPADVQCGRAIQARVVAVATGLYSYEELHETAPDHLYADFSNLDDVLGSFRYNDPEANSG